MKTKEQKNKIMRYIIITALLIIPFMYSFFYLKAFWNPYGKMDEIPVAIVNLDEGDRGEELVKTLKEKNTLKLLELKEEKALEALQDGSYYAVLTIPKNFSSDLEKASTKQRTQTMITYAPNQKSNYLASQIIGRVVVEVEKELNANINQEIVTTLSDKLSLVPTQVKEMEDGLGKIEDGAKTLNQGTDTLTTGIHTLNTNYQIFDNGIHTLENGSIELTNGVTTLQSGSHNLNIGLNEYVSNVNNIADSMVDLSTLLTTLSAHPEYINVPAVKAQLDKANTMLTSLTTTTETGSKIEQLKYSGNALVNGANELDQGAISLQTGVQTLEQGIHTLNVSSTQIKDGIATIENGAIALKSGTETLYDGVVEARNKVKTSRVEAEEEVKALDGLADYAKAPTVIEEKDYVEVGEYGTAFAPYFMSISLWVGALMLFVVLYYDVLDRFPAFSRNSKEPRKRTFAYMGLATVQGISLGLLLQWGLGYSVTNYFLYYAALILASNAFILMIEFFIVNFNDVGKFLAILLLVLQLAGSAGTFPIETVPKMFQVIYPFMPMHYTINLFKEALIVINHNLLMNSIAVVIGIVIVFFGMNMIKDYQLIKAQNKK